MDDDVADRVQGRPDHRAEELHDLCNETALFIRRVRAGCYFRVQMRNGPHRRCTDCPSRCIDLLDNDGCQLVFLVHHVGHQARGLALQPLDLLVREHWAGEFDVDEWHGLAPVLGYVDGTTLPQNGSFEKRVVLQYHFGEPARWERQSTSISTCCGPS